jgi:magnesium transporter
MNELDTSNMTDTQPWLILQNLINEGDSKKLNDFLESIFPSETARAVSHLNEENRKKLLLLLDPEDAAEFLLDLPDEQAADLIEDISAKEAAVIMDQMPTDEQADILLDINEVDVEAILKAMPKKEAEKTRQLLQYYEDSAGGLMSTAFLAYPETMSVGRIVEDMRIQRDTYSDYDVQYVYIISNNGKLKGVLRLRDLLLTSPVKKAKSLLIPNPVHVLANTNLEDLIELFDEHAYLGVPVTDEKGYLIGIVRRTQVLEASERRSENSFLKSSGIVGGEEFRYMPLHQRSFRRLSWLSINIVLNIIAASVIAFYQETLAAVIALAVFLPIISDMSGCSGNQAVAVSIRELTLGLIKPYEIIRVFLKEIGIGLLNGVILGSLLGTVAFLWNGNPYLGLVVGGALATNTLVAVCLGGIIPLVLKKFGTDPALASSPILTTVTDMCGFFLALSFATALLPLLS